MMFWQITSFLGKSSSSTASELQIAVLSGTFAALLTVQGQWLNLSTHSDGLLGADPT
jgi:hypothetical protein